MMMVEPWLVIYATLKVNEEPTVKYSDVLCLKLIASSSSNYLKSKVQTLRVSSFCKRVAQQTIVQEVDSIPGLKREIFHVVRVEV